MLIDPVWTDDVQQSLFRAILEAAARPGRIVSLEPLLYGASARTGLLATLVDGGVTFSNPHGLLPEEDALFLQTLPASSGTARFILASGGKEPDFTPHLGDLENPEFGATIIMQVDSLSHDHGSLQLVCTGPGVETEHRLFADGLDPVWLQRRHEWNGYFPLGVDIFLVDATQAAALPRTTRIQIIEEQPWRT